MTGAGGEGPLVGRYTDWRKVDHERAQRAPSARWPTQDVLDLWKAHGGEWHGPNVETVTMPMYLLSAFLDAHAVQALASAEAARDEAVRRARAEALEDAARIAETEEAYPSITEAMMQERLDRHRADGISDARSALATMQSASACTSRSIAERIRALTPGGAA